MEKILTRLGLGPKEQKVYKLILDRGKISAAQISRAASINRTTVYGIAKELLAKGLVIEDLGGKVLYYLPARETELEKIIKREKEVLDEKESAVHELQDVLKNLPQSQTYSVPKIRFVEGRDMEHYFREAFPRWFESMKHVDPSMWGFQDHTLLETFEHMIDYSWDVTPAGLDIKLFTNQSDIEKKMLGKKYAERRNMKFWETDQFSATQLVAGDYIAMIMTKQKPYYLVEIHDAVMAHNMRQVFKKLWEELK
ncbi:MAG: hypothetical protein JWM20_321 [Patescibacteria group bacterium]|nr:hypothetical protein [Patescibacteria group bacterium]